MTHLQLPGGHSGSHPMFHHGHHTVRKVVFLCFGLFWAGSVVCALGAVNKIASSLKMEARMKALDKMPEAFTEEERLELVQKITTRALAAF